MLRPLVFLAMILSAGSAHGDSVRVPNFWDPRERVVAPDLESYQRIRFLTTIDFPPFNMLGVDGTVVGFHVDLAREICDVLVVTQRCQIQALPWEELRPALAAGNGEAIIAGLAVTAETRAALSFTRPYLKLPARFVVPRSSAMAEPIQHNLSGRRIGVRAGSAHEQILSEHFPSVRRVAFTRDDFMLGAVAAGTVDGVFGDGLQLSFWLADTASGDCCRFAGGPFLFPDYLGNGLAIAVRATDERLATAFDYALRELSVNGTFAELYLRHFPVGYF